MTSREPSSADSEAAGLHETISAAARKSGVAQVVPGEAPTGVALLAAMGGVRGLIESILPGLAFLVLFTVTANLAVSVLVPVAIAIVFVIVRAVTRQPIRSAVAGVIGIALSAGLALLTGRAEDNFVWGFVVNFIALGALLVSLVARRPLVGVIAALITGEGQGWRSDKAKFKVASIATILWIALFSLRLGVELPLYFAGNTTALAGVKLLLGVPLYAAMLWVTWLLMRTVYGRESAENRP